MRHDAVEAAVYRAALIMGFQAVRQPLGLDTASKLRPDLVVVLPGRRILTDVAIVHPVTLSKARGAVSLQPLGAARRGERQKRGKYLKLNSSHGMEQLPFVVETCGGLGPSAVALLKAMARAAQEQLSMWPKWDIIRHVVGSVAVAVQRGTAMTYLQGYDRALSALAQPLKGRGRAEERVEAGGAEASDSEEEAWGESDGEAAGDFE